MHVFITLTSKDSQIFTLVLWASLLSSKDLYFFTLDAYTLNSPSVPQPPRPRPQAGVSSTPTVTPLCSLTSTLAFLRLLLYRAAQETCGKLRPPSTSFLLHLKSDFQTMVCKAHLPHELHGHVLFSSSTGPPPHGPSSCMSDRLSLFLTHGFCLCSSLSLGPSASSPLS